jgi:hypothetical protein
MTCAMTIHQASIAAIEFNDYDFIEASAIGFGTPSTLSPKLSAAYQDIICTIICDADIVPRLGISSAIHLHVRLMAHNPDNTLFEDISDFVKDLQTKLPTKVADFLREGQENIRLKLNDMLSPGKAQHIDALKEYLKGREKVSAIEPEPPGTCIHIFRDGIGYTASYTPCSYFSEIEFVPTMIDDHLVRPGYHRALVTLARDLMQDLDFQFEHQKLPDTS